MKLLDPFRFSIAETVHKILLGDDSNSSELPTIEEVASYIEIPPNSEMGDFALPCFRFSKALKKKPVEISQLFQQSAEIQANPWIAKAVCAGPFLNFFVDKTSMANWLLPKIDDGSYFDLLRSVSSDRGLSRVMIEFSQPNTHKELHIGHGRNMCLGDALVRLYRSCGFEVTAANYPGDEGTHIAKCLWYMGKEKLQPPEENRGQWLGEVYAKASRTLANATPAERKKFDEGVSEVLAAIESKTGPTFELWKETRQWSLDLFTAVYHWMDIEFDCYFYESELSDDSQKIVDEYLNKGVFIESDGAVGCDLNDDGLGFMMVRKSDGNTLYATKDLVLARRKFDQFNIERSIYVVASEQNLHFRQVFKTLERMGFDAGIKCFHLSYGHVRLPEGKMSSRDGTAVSFQQLREMIEEKLTEYLKKYDDWDGQRYQETMRQLCVGAIRYGMVSTDPAKDIVFRLDDWVSFEGSSGPYLMYSYARTQSILRKASEAGYEVSQECLELLTEDVEQELLNLMYQFNLTVKESCLNDKPSLLGHMLYDLCRCFNRFYNQQPILKAENSELLQARLSLASSFARVLHFGLNLLGIHPPGRM